MRAFFENLFVGVGTLAILAAFVWLVFSTDTQFHLGVLFGMALVSVTGRLFNGFWPMDHRFIGRRVDQPQWPREH